MKKKNDSDIDNESFFEKYKSDSKYKAKVQLLGGIIFIGILVILMNFSSTASGDNSNLINLINNNEIIENKDNIKDSLINKLKVNNYSYLLEISMNKENILDKITYDGKIFSTSSYVIKTYKDKVEEYYIDKDNYYLKENDKYILVNSNNYYSFVTSSFMDINNIINYINVAEKKETYETQNNKIVTSYNIKISEITLNNSDEYISIDVIEEQNSESIELNVNYTNLYKIYDNKVNDLSVKYIIKDFNKIEKFNININ